MIALLLLAQGFNDYNNGFETGTTADWSLEAGSGAEAVSGVGSLPPINGGFSGKMESGTGIGGSAESETIVSVTAVRLGAPTGEQELCVDVRILSAGLPSETGTLSFNVAPYGAGASTGVSPSAFSPIAVPDATFNFTTAVISLCVPITILPGQQDLTISVSYAVPATETAGPFALLLDDLRIEPVGGAAFDACVAHTGRGFEPFQNPSHAGCCATVAGRRIGPSLPSSILAPRIVDPQDGSIDGLAVPLHTGSFTFSTFT